jgi:hypothetical protein
MSHAGGRGELFVAGKMAEEHSKWRINNKKLSSSIENLPQQISYITHNVNSPPNSPPYFSHTLLKLLCLLYLLSTLHQYNYLPIDLFNLYPINIITIFLQQYTPRSKIATIKIPPHASKNK